MMLGAIAWGLLYWLDSRGVESTDDAYVNGDVVLISPQIAGTAVTVMVRDTDWVRAGTPLLQLDRTDARLELDAATERLARAVRDYRAAHADAERERAQIQLRESDAARAADDLQRRLSLERDGGVALEDVRHARDSVRRAQADLDAQRAAYVASVSRTDGTTIASNPLVLAAAADVRSAALALHRTEVRAPLDGIVTRRIVQVGQHVSPGIPVMSMVPLDHVWVDANFKESQLRSMRAGQAVDLRSDLYGADVVYHGRIVGFEAGTGAAFAAVPAQNATGNWIKVVQRVPVRVALDPDELRAHPLRVGLSMSASVTVADGAAHDGAALAMSRPWRGIEPHPVETTTIFHDEEGVGDALVRKTIEANSASALPAAHVQGE